MFYAAKCYWPGVNETEFEAIAARATENSSRDARHGAKYLGSLLFRDDELVLCMFEAPSPSAVKRASDRAGIPCERVMDSIWLEPRPDTENEQHHHGPWQAWGRAHHDRNKAGS